MTITHPPAHPSVPTPEYEYSADGKTVTFKNAGECLRAAQAGDETMDYAEQLRAAVETVCEGWTLPPGARKTLEAALWAPQVSPRATADVERAAKDDRISMPTNALQAEGMMKLGLAWLQHNAPERLTNAGRATADVKDAARYRYLRDYHIGDDPESINLDAAKRPGLDAAIDAAIATTKPGA